MFRAFRLAGAIPMMAAVYSMLTLPEKRYLCRRAEVLI